MYAPTMESLSDAEKDRVFEHRREHVVQELNRIIIGGICGNIK